MDANTGPHPANCLSLRVLPGVIHPIYTQVAPGLKVRM